MIQLKIVKDINTFTIKMDQEIDNLRNFCCFCGDECNPASQSCGPCMRKSMYFSSSHVIVETSTNSVIDFKAIPHQDTPEDLIHLLNLISPPIDDPPSKFTNVEHENEDKISIKETIETQKETTYEEDDNPFVSRKRSRQSLH